MRRASLFAFLPAVLLLASCGAKPTMQPAEVLERASRASQDLASVHFAIQGSLTGEGSLPWGDWAEFSAEGRMQDGGTQVDLTLHVKGGGSTAQGDESMEATAGIIVAGESEIYVKLDAIEMDPPHPLFSSPMAAAALGKWWLIEADVAEGATPVTPNPQLLKMQANVVSVIRDRSFATLNGRNCYRYEVTIDPAKLLTFLEEVARERGDPLDRAAAEASIAGYDVFGTLWIDAETFFVQQIQWKAVPKHGKGVAFDLFATFSEHNAAAPVAPPQGAEPLENAMESMLPKGLPMPVEGMTGGLTPEQEEELLNTILRGTP